MSEPRIPYVQRVKRAGGRVDLYFRKGDFREGPLANADGTPELQVEVDLILARLDRAAKAQKPRAGTVAGALDDYERSADFRSLAFSTQGEYGRLAKELRTDCGALQFKEVTLPLLRALRDGWALRGHKAANDRVQVLKNALQPAIDDELIEGDPFARLKKVARPHDAGESHPIWEAGEVDAAIEAAIARKMPGLARAIALGRWGGFRRGTICAFPLHARVQGQAEHGGVEPRLYWITEKRKVLCDKREDGRLTALLVRTPAKALTVAYNARSEPWKPRQLNQAIDRLLATLAKAGKVRAAKDDAGEIYCPLTIHGLRHARGVELAQAGASDAEIMSQLEHASDRAAKIYRRQADRRRLADTAQDRIDGVIDFKAKQASKA